METYLKEAFCKKKRMLEINDKIENYNKTNEMLDNLEKNVGELEKRVSY